MSNYWLIAAVLFATFITFYLIAKIWSEVFWKEGKVLPKLYNFRYFDKLKLEKKVQIVAPIIFLAFVSLFIGFGAEYIQQLALRVANELTNNQHYVQSVLGKQMIAN